MEFEGKLVDQVIRVNDLFKSASRLVYKYVFFYRILTITIFPSIESNTIKWIYLIKCQYRVNNFSERSHFSIEIHHHFIFCYQSHSIIISYFWIKQYLGQERPFAEESNCAETTSVVASCNLLSSSSSSLRYC